MEEQKKALKIRRTTIKAAITRIQNFVTSSDTAEDRAQFERRRDTLIEKMREFEQVQVELLTLDEVEDLDATIAVENQYFTVLAKLDEIINSNTSARAITPTISQLVEIPSNRLRLPQVDLPKFGGQFDEWYPFHDTFKKLIHEKSSLSDIERFHYLKSSLTGDAAQTIESLEISEVNYTEAWEMLIRRYDDKKTVIQLHIESLSDLPILTKENRMSLRVLVNGALKHTRALKALKRPLWDDWLVTVIARKLDTITRKTWEASLTSSDMPSFEQMIDFLERQCRILHSSSPKPSTSTSNVSASTKPNLKQTVSCVGTKSFTCPICKENHFVHQCDKFLKMSIEKRFEEAKNRKLCLNCLKSSSHFANSCTSGQCKKCHKKHNSLLHMTTIDKTESAASASRNTDTDDGEARTVVANVGISRSVGVGQGILATAIVDIADANGNSVRARALIDPGSLPNFVTDDIAKRLNLKRSKLDVAICGIGRKQSRSKDVTTLTFKSRHTGFSRTIHCVILPEIMYPLPLETSDRDRFKIPNNLQLADPDFNVSSEIDLLIGVEVFWDLMCVGQVQVTRTQPCIQKTMLGWVVSGPLPFVERGPRRTACNVATNQDLAGMMAKFWELDDCSRGSNFTRQERECEDHFRATHSRGSDGRFIVRLPTKEDKIKEIGPSREIALKRFYALERKLKANPVLKQEYSAFMKEYIQLNHMRHTTDNPNAFCYYMPHHAVTKQTSLTTKLRVVFDASSKSASGVSLNDALKVGPTIQEELFAILTRFRTFTFVLTTDLKKMYRQIRIHEEQVSLQKILWRENEQEEVKDYELMTVTYGTAPASFLAVRCMHEIASLEEGNAPVGSAIIRRDFYVDDLITGANTIAELLIIREQVTAVLDKACFKLHKWASNSQELLAVPVAEEASNLALNLSKRDDITTLGVRWNPHEDELLFAIPELQGNKRTTKRRILSTVARIFDPLGLISPVVVTAKILVQQLWIQGLGWDESVPIAIHTRWAQFEEELTELNALRIARRVTAYDDATRVDLNGFSDASEAAYGACVYVVCTNSEGARSSHLLCAKSRVAPVKSTTLPRLELCGALLLARLLKKVMTALSIAINNVYCWTDSTIVLSWIKAPARNWVTFVANRVGEIQDLLPAAKWNHVTSEQNPADVISRGTSPKQLIESLSWWHGPPLIFEFCENEETNKLMLPCIDDLPEKRKGPIACMTVTQAKKDEQFSLRIFKRYSAFGRLVRVTAYCLRFMENLKKTRGQRSVGCLTTAELTQSTEHLVRLCQASTFSEELKVLRAKRQLRLPRALARLNPFLDDHDIIRVAGRLRNARLPYAQKCPIILPKSHPFTELIIEYEHKRNLHSGIQLTLYAVRTRYWPLGGRNAVRKIVHGCITCFRNAPKFSQYVMAPLPADRVIPARPFSNCGVDYCGPFYVREGARRNAKTHKAYVAIFICFATKAVHIELVSDQTTATFISALKRFMSRRGKPGNIHSDNGSNFIGANRELAELHNALYVNDGKRKIAEYLTENGIDWHFIPPRAPHFGGLWEAAVKSAKHHLKRIVGDASLRFEELYTLLTQVEAVLNSRPITPISSDPHDFLCLTPGHFLIGDRITSNAEPDLTDIKINRLSRWQYIEQLRQHFWKRWSREYLSQINQRAKWTSASGLQLQINQMVIVREDNLPPLRWILGRIEAVLPGEDGIVRAARVRTSHGVMKRPATKLCVLPIEK